MLKNFVNSGPQGTLITIQDDNTAKGWNLFKSFLKADIQDTNINKIHLVCFENPPSYYLDIDENLKVMKYDFFTDPCSWMQNNTQPSSLFNKILEIHSSVASTIFIDSLNMMICLEDINIVYNTLKNLKDAFKNIKCILHTDVIENSVNIDQIHFCSNIILKLHLKLPSKVSGNRKYMGVDGIYQKPSGKVIKLKEVFYTDLKYNLYSEVCPKEEKDKSCSNVNQNLNSLTTFRLGLDMKESERIARDNLVLPYLRSSNEKTKNQEEGKILYYAEAGDDEEEDPDDDLDI